MADRFDKFTERARRVLTLAQEEALRFNHDYIGTEHVLLGLVRENEGVAARAIRNLGAELTKVRSAVEFIVGRGDRAVMGEIGLTPRAKKIIELSVDEARRMGHHYIGTEHLLLGTIREGEGIAAGVLESLGISLDRARAEVGRLLAGGEDRPASTPLEASGLRIGFVSSVHEIPHESSEVRSYEPLEDIPPLDEIMKKLGDNGRATIKHAEKEARRFNHNYVGTEHILLALVGARDSLASTAIENIGIQLNQARSAVEFIIGRGERQVSGAISLTPRAQKVLQFSYDEARRLTQEHIGPEHLLLGLVREGEGIAAGVLESLGVSVNKVRREVYRLLIAAGVPVPTEVRRSAGIREPAVIIDGKAIAAEVREEAKQRADKLHERGITPGLALVLAGENPSSLSYLRSKGDAAEQAGIYSDMFQFPENVDGQTLLSRILDLNDDGRFHGILVQLPLPDHLDEHSIINAIDPSKDADGVTPMSLGRLLRGEPGPWPATPAGIVELLNRSGYPPAGKHVVVCGRSNIVGKPVAAILMQKSDRANATVTVCHTGTPDLASYTRQADILIAAMGRPGAITAGMVKPGVVVIDVGNNWIEDESRQSGRRLVGDVEFEGVRQVAAAITPVPGGVGPMTVAMLLSNTVMLAEQQAGRH
jgi:methylenetetrahydrofolate dehydrogenase (NADP+) / methenyltetrahydrofolate cyclohydrolase